MMWELRRTVSFVAGRPNHVLIFGATGTGKELVARAIHTHSARSKVHFVSRNAATIPASLVDAELFGNEKNYPNPGMPERLGLIGEADGGTLFLDEFTEMVSAAEAHLLRVLDQGEYQRLGEARSRRSTFRLIAATNRDPSAIKHDLLARLTLRIATPDLNQRREDVPLLVNPLFRQMATDDPDLARRFFPDGDVTREPRISVDFMRALVTHDYSANVRELQRLLLEAVRTTDGDELQAPTRAPSPRSMRPSEPSAPFGNESSEPSAPEEPLPAGLTAARVQASLDENNGALEPTWRALGLSSRHALRRLIQKHQIEVRRRPKQR
jgi:DNA-binding NtrC family response regulator